MIATTAGNWEKTVVFLVRFVGRDILSRVRIGTLEGNFPRNPRDQPLVFRIPATNATEI